MGSLTAEHEAKEETQPEAEPRGQSSLVGGVLLAMAVLGVVGLLVIGIGNLIALSAMGDRMSDLGDATDAVAFDLTTSEQIEAAELRWSEQQPDVYSLISTVWMPEITPHEQVRVVVDGSTMVQAVRLSPSVGDIRPAPPTIEELFGALSDLDPSTITELRFDSGTGLPLHMEARSESGEIIAQIEIEDFRPGDKQPLVWTNREIDAALKLGLERWESEGPTIYDFRYRYCAWSCMSASGSIDWSGEVTLRGEFPEPERHPQTVLDMFEHALAAKERIGMAAMTFDPQFGYPNRIWMHGGGADGDVTTTYEVLTAS